MSFILRGLNFNNFLNTCSPFTYHYDRGAVLFPHPLRSVFALFTATIDKSHLESLVNLEKLKEAFPDRVQIIDSNVVLKGPVSIIASPVASISHKTTLSLLTFTIAFFTLGYLGSKVLNYINNNANLGKGDARKKNEERIETIAGAAVIGISIISAVVTYRQASKLWPTARGIYFH